MSKRPGHKKRDRKHHPAPYGPVGPHKPKRGSDEALEELEAKATAMNAYLAEADRQSINRARNAQRIAHNLQARMPRRVAPPTTPS